MVRQFVAGLLTVLFLGIGHSIAEETAAPDDMRVGDRWSYDVKDDTTGDLRRAITYVAIEITDKEITTRAMERGKTGRTPSFSAANGAVWIMASGRPAQAAME